MKRLLFSVWLAWGAIFFTPFTRAATEQFSITLNQNVSSNAPGPGAGNIEVAGALDVYTFTATAGRVVYFDEQSNDTCATRINWRCTDSTGAVLFDEQLANSGPCGVHDPGLLTLTNGGTYTITVSGQATNTGIYQFTVWTVTNQQFTVALNQSVSNNIPAAGAGNIEIPGVKDIYTFTAAPGQVVYFDEQSNDTCATRINWRCTDSTGAVLFDEQLANSGPCGVHDPGNITLTNGGTYTVTVYGVADATNTYQFTIWSVTNQQFTVSVNQSVSNNIPAAGAGNIETPGVKDIFTFTAAPGQVVYFDEQSNDTCATRINWRRTDSTGAVLFDEQLAFSGPCGVHDPGIITLTNGGTYTITVYGQADATNTYQFTLWSVTDQRFSTALNQVVSNSVPAAGAGNIETPGVKDIYTFTAAPGQVVYFDEQSNDTCSTRINWRCTDSTGAVLFDEQLAFSGPCGVHDPGNITLTNGGTYTITVYGVTDATNTYQFALWSVTNQQFNIVVGQPVATNFLPFGAGAIETPGVKDIYTFTAVPGQVVYFDEQSNDTCSTRISWRCTDSAGAVLFEEQLANSGPCGIHDPGNITLTNGGTYTITVYGLADATGPYQFQIWPIIDQSFTIALSRPVTYGQPLGGAGAIETPGVKDTYSFTAMAGAVVYFDERSGDTCSSRINWRCADALGRVLFDEQIGQSGPCGIHDPGLFTLTNGGAYTITVYGQADNTGIYEFTVWNVTNQLFDIAVGQGVTNNVPIQSAGVIETPGVKDIYLLTVAPGTRVYFDEQSGEACETRRIFWRLEGPGISSNLFNEPIASQGPCAMAEPGLLTLTNGGTYTITVFGENDAVGSYAFKLWNEQPVILVQPQSVTRPIGDNAIFSVIADSRTPATYQWRFNGALLSGRTNSVLTLNDLQSSQAGQYSVVVSNAFGTVTSAIAVLTVTTQVPNLAAQNLLTPAHAYPGQPIVISWITTNSGNGTAGAPWRDTVLLSPTTNISGSISLGAFVNTNSLAPGGLTLVSQTVIVPANLSGARYLVVLTDNTNEVAEGHGESNNVSAAAQPMQILSPDLIVTSLRAPVSATFGESANIIWTIRNNGTNPAYASWTDQLLLSADTFVGNDRLLLSTPAPTFLAAGASYTQTQQVTIPLATGLNPGNYFILAFTDAANVQAETNENNNVTNAPIALSLPPLPDLAIATFVPPPFATPGSFFEISWTVTNRGSAMATGVWAETVAVSTDALVGNDVSLATFLFTNTLPVGGFVTRTQQVFYPIDGPAGDVRFLLAADSFSDIVESSETNNIAIATNISTVTPWLTLVLDSDTTSETGPTITATVVRNGSLSQALSITISNSAPDEISAPPGVVILLGQAVATFALAPARDNIVDGSQSAIVTVTAAGFISDSRGVTVNDIDVAHLTLQLSTNTVIEGGSINARVTRELVTTNSLRVFVNTASDGRLQTPLTVTIPPNAASTNFPIVAIQDSTVGPTRAFSVRAAASGYEDSNFSTVDVVDDDVPLVVLNLSTTTISEGSGPQAAMATVTRLPTSTHRLLVDLESSAPNVVRVPERIIIPAGQAAFSFPVAAVDNTAADGTRSVQITPFVVDSVTAERLATGVPATLTVTDDDGPTLLLVIAQKLVGEALNIATTATVLRNGSTSAGLTVFLSSSDITEATVPGAVVIPAGQASITFNIASVNDAIIDGNQSVTITASAPNFGSGSDTLVVSDANQPDLVISSINVPATADTEAFINLSYRVSNQGRIANSSNFLTRIFLSKDAVVGDDTLLTQFTFTGQIPPGQFFEQTLQVRLPTAAGNYWIVVSTDVENVIPEILENNNNSITRVPVQVTAAYAATVQTSVEIAPAGTPLPLTGRAYRGSVTSLVPFVPVNIHLNVRGTRRIISALTDASGTFNTSFTPLPTEAGYYEIGAAHPGDTNAPVQDSFTLVGMKATLPDAPLKLLEQVARTNVIEFYNLSDLPLTGLSVSIVSNLASVSASLSLPTNSLGGFETNRLIVVLTPQNRTIQQGTVTLRIASAEGAVLTIPLDVRIAPLVATLTTDPNALVAGMRRGGQRLVEFTVANLGGAPSGPLSVLLPPFPWMHVSSSNPLPSLAPGASNLVLIQLTPEPTLPLGDYTGALVVRGSNASVSVPFTFRSLSDAKGDLLVTAVDEYTFYAEGSPPLAGARVSVKDAVSGTVVTNGITDTNGHFFAGQLVETYYDVTVTAEKHSVFNGRTLLGIGVTNNVEAFLSREVVRYIWRVVPTQIEDITKITIETEFETFVPIPVVTIEPNVIDLAEINAEVTQIDLRISNHGLIAANHFRLQFGGNGNWSFTPLVSDVGTLPANSSLVVPLTIRRLTPFPNTAPFAARAKHSAKAGGGGGCISARGVWDIVCGVVRSYSAPIGLANAGGDCGGGIGGGGIGGGGGGGTLGSAPFFAMPSPCDEDDCDGDECDDCEGDDCDDCEEKEIEYNGDLVVKPLVKAAEASLNAALAFNPYTRVLFSEAGIKFKPKAGARTCCDPEGFEFFAEAEGEVEVGIGPGKTEKLPSVPLPLAGGQTIDLMGEFFFGVQAKPKGTVKAEVSTGCDGEPKGSASLKIEIPIIAGVKGEALLKLRPITSTNFEQKSEIIGAVRGGISFEYTYDSETGSKFCYKSEGIYAQVVVKAPQLGIPEISPFPGEGGKHYFVEPQTICDPVGLALPPELAAEFDRAIAQAKALAVRKSLSRGKAVRKVVAKADEGGVCAKVRLRLDQDLILTRNAFNATLELINGDPATALEDINVQVSILDANGFPANDRFDIRTNELIAITATEGNGVLAPNTTGTALWILVPTRDAAPESDTRYSVGGFLSYRQGGVRVTVPFVPVPITVQPDPRLVVKYFHQRDVFSDDPFTPITEPSIPYSLAVMVQNTGKGVARNVHITSAQPQIIENEKGLLIDFKIIGTEVAGKNLTPSLTVEFGQIDPDTTSIGRWLLTSTLQGLFNKYEATFEHTAGAANKTISLVDDVSIHEMIHLVQAAGAFEDNKPDFLVNQNPDPPLDLPDTLYLSDGTTNRVEVRTNATVSGAVSTGNLSVPLNTAPSVGWVYLRVLDPGTNRFRLTRVLRSDGVEVPVGTNAWQTDRTFIGTGRKPRNENTLHLLDYGSSGSYTLFYEVPTQLDNTPPSSAVAMLPGDSFAQIAVNWAGEDSGGSGLAYFDIYVSQNGGPFVPWIRETRLNGGVYFGSVSNTYAFYSVAVDNSGNRELAPTTADAVTRVSRVNHPPTLEAVNNRTITEGDTLVVDLSATDPDGDQLSFTILGTPPVGMGVSLNTGQLTWPTGPGSGPGTNTITVQVLDNGTPRLGVTRTFIVTVLDVNSPPTLSPISDYSIIEGRLLVVTNRAVDRDFAGQMLTFRLGPGTPAGAIIDPLTGVFNWRPSEVQGGTTNRIAVIVSDNGTPSLSATQFFNVIVRDALPDFILALGTTNLYVGETNFVPVTLTSGLDLASVSVTLDVPVLRLTNFALQPLVPELASAILQPIDPTHSQITLNAGTGFSLQGSRAVARITFGTDANQRSVIVPLNVLNPTARKSDGTLVESGQARGGRVFLVGVEPVLDAMFSTNGQRILTLYGLAAATYDVEGTTRFEPPVTWTTLGQVTITNRFQAIPIVAGPDTNAFYRAVRR